MKKNILLFGANSFISKTFIRDYSAQYSIYPVYRKAVEQSLHIDFENSNDIEDFSLKIDFPVDAILFLQGINPTMGVADITEDHFSRMLKINLVTPVLLIRELKGKITEHGTVIFFSSVSKRKGSYDPSYASAKAGLVGLMHSLANAYPRQRFNLISLGLVEGSPVYNEMTEDFRTKHSERMHNNSFIKPENVAQVIDMIISNNNINRSDIAIDGGYN